MFGLRLQQCGRHVRAETLKHTLSRLARTLQHTARGLRLRQRWRRVHGRHVLEVRVRLRRRRRRVGVGGGDRPRQVRHVRVVRAGSATYDKKGTEERRKES